MRSSQVISCLRIFMIPTKHVRSRLCSIAAEPQRTPAINCYKIMNGRWSLFPNITKSNISQICEDMSFRPVHEIFEEVELSACTPFDYMLLLKSLKRKVKANYVSAESLKNYEGFHQLCEAFYKTCDQLSYNCLVSGLKSLLIIGVDPQSTCIETVENVILDRIRYFDICTSIECLSFHYCHVSTDSQEKVVQALIDKVQCSMNEINYDAALFKLIQCYQCFDKTSLKTLNLKLVELVSLQSPGILCKIICTLAEQPSRNKALLDAISSHLCWENEKPDLKTTIDVLYAMNRLNYPDMNLLLYLTNDRITEIESVNEASVISGLLTCCGHLKFRNTDVLEACGKWLLEHVNLCSSRELVAYVLTIATLNYLPQNANILKHLVSHLSKDVVGSNLVWLDVVWSLAILEHADKEMLKSALKKSFYEPLICGKDFRAANNKMKIMNLLAVMKEKHPELTFNYNVFLDYEKVPKRYYVEKFKKSVTDALSNCITKKGHLCIDKLTHLGFCVDAEFIMNSKGESLSMSEYGSELNFSNGMYQELPHGAKRFALLSWTFKDFTLDEETLTGVNSLIVRILESLHYTVLQVSYKDIASHTTLSKVHYLQGKIKLALESCWPQTKV